MEKKTKEQTNKKKTIAREGLRFRIDYATKAWITTGKSPAPDNSKPPLCTLGLCRAQDQQVH